MKDELNVEGGQVLDFGVMHENVNNAELLTHFTTLYDTYAGGEKQIYYIFGTSEAIKAYSYGDFDTGDVSICAGDSCSTITIQRRVKEDLSVTKTNSKITVKIEGKDYVFDLGAGEYFYFVLSENIGDARYVVPSN